MLLQEQIALVIDSQRENLRTDPTDLIRESLERVPVIDSFATIITGIRRCGKSTLLHQVMDKKHFENSLFLNFDDIRFAGFEASDFTRLYNEMVKRGSKVIFLDEIQLFTKWEIFVQQLLRERYRVFISGSNASLLSSELGTHLTGRHVSMELFPFSYKEYLTYLGLNSNENSLLAYLNSGGIPEFVKNKFPAILHILLNDILIRDIAVRKSIRDVESLRLMAVYLLSNVGNLISANGLTGMFGIKSSATILDFFSFFKDSYLIEMIPQFSYSLKAQSRNPKKVFAMDMGLISAVSTSFTENNGHKLENLIYLFLRNRYRNIFYYNNKYECDFVIFENEKTKLAIQVCWQLKDDNMKRELNGLLNAMNELKINEGTIVTFSQNDSIETEGKHIHVMPACEYLNISEASATLCFNK
jgi:uncharacterized protein